MDTSFSKKLTTILALFFSTFLFSQNDTNQNGIKTSVISDLVANAEQAKRYEIASIGYNSQHWQPGGLIIIELFQTSYGTGYEKYVIENGYLQGANSGLPAVKLIESQGAFHSCKISLGTTIDLTTNIGGYINKQLPIFFDVRYYASYKIKITYLQEKVDLVTDINQIKINQNPIATNIPDFSVSNALNYDLTTTGNLRISGDGNHYVQNGNFGIGTTIPKNKLDVNGTIHSKEVKVDITGWSDFVFKKEYDLPTLEEVEKHINEKGHLENIPNEEEVLKNGINLGEMNTKLLQKIEELTLYMIEQNRQLKIQNDQILLQNREIQLLKKTKK